MTSPVFFQETEHPVSPASFSEALTLYLSRCGQQPGEQLREFSLVLISLLRDFISSLRCQDGSFRGKPQSRGHLSAHLRTLTEFLFLCQVRCGGTRKSWTPTPVATWD